MKNFYQVLLAITFAALLSCEKETITLQEPPELQRKQASNPWAEAANASNPYEELAIGIYHNAALDRFKYARDEYSHPQAWLDSSYQVVQNFFCLQTDSTYCDPSLSLMYLKSLVDTARSEDLFTLSLSGHSQKLQEYLSRLFITATNHSPSTYYDFKTEVEILEYEITADLQLGHKDQQCLLLATQVARYSGLYWKQELENNFSSWEGVTSDMQTADWAAIVTVDIRGSVVGYHNGLYKDSRVLYAANSSPGSSLREFIEKHLQM